MIQRLRSDDVVGMGPWVRTLTLTVLAIVQTVPIALGGWIVGAALGWSPSGVKPTIGHLLAGVAFVGSGVLILYATYRDWRYGTPLHGRRSLFAGLVLLVAAPVLLFVFRR